MMIVLHDHAQTHICVFILIITVHIYHIYTHMYSSHFDVYIIFIYIYITIWTLSFFVRHSCCVFGWWAQDGSGNISAREPAGEGDSDDRYSLEYWIMGIQGLPPQCHLKPQEIRPYNLLGNYQGAMMVNSPLIRPYVLRGLALGGGTLRFPWC